MFERDFETLHFVQDRNCGLRAVLAVHSTLRGPAFGGIRRVRCSNVDEAIDQALRLAEAMSQKCALAGLPAGGAKTVIVDHPGLLEAGAYRALGRFVESLGGRYIAGPDVGTGEPQLAAMRSATRFVNPGGNDAARATARGVLAGLEGLMRARDDPRGFAGLAVAIEGLGAVGRRIAETLVASGASVSGTDPDPQARDAAASLGVRVVEPEVLHRESCDLFMPCGPGATITEERARHAQFRMICGSANNQLDSDDVEATLREREIAWAPDIVVSAGAVIEGVLTMIEGREAAAVVETIDQISGRCETVVRTALAEGRLVGEVAREQARLAMRGGA